ncbi:MAG TPA: FAD-binding protein, partial [Candidatus Coatesbacteria bacterium]|nr:FAD-binding protein [Candidatus Coatesbacteria bacterium]
MFYPPSAGGGRRWSFCRPESAACRTRPGSTRSWPNCTPGRGITGGRRSCGRGRGRWPVGADRVLVLGAGLTGLAAADRLAAAGAPCLVLERGSSVGGLAAGIVRNGFSFDYGPHRFHTPEPRLERFFTDLFPDGAWLVPRRKSEIQLVGRRFAYPLELGDVVRKLDFTDNVRAFADYMVSALRRAFSRPAEKSFEDWVINRFGRTLYDLYFGPYTEKL